MAGEHAPSAHARQAAGRSPSCWRAVERSTSRRPPKPRRDSTARRHDRARRAELRDRRSCASVTRETASARSPARCATRLTSTARRTAAARSRAVVLSGAALDIPASPTRSRAELGVALPARPSGVRRRGCAGGLAAAPGGRRRPRRSRRRTRNEGRQPDPRRPARRRGRRWRTLRRRRRTSCSACSAGWRSLALLYGIARHQVSSRRSEAASLTAEAQQAQARAGQLAPYTSFMAMREQRVAGRLRSSSTRASTGLTPSTSSVACCREQRLADLAGRHGRLQLGLRRGSAAATEPARRRDHARGERPSGPSVTSATPPGSIPTFTLAGCATSQTEVAQMLERLRLIDGVKEVTLQSSTQSSTKSELVRAAAAARRRARVLRADRLRCAPDRRQPRVRLRRARPRPSPTRRDRHRSGRRRR